MLEIGTEFALEGGGGEGDEGDTGEVSPTTTSDLRAFLRGGLVGKDAWGCDEDVGASFVAPFSVSWSLDSTPLAEPGPDKRALDLLFRIKADTGELADVDIRARRGGFHDGDPVF